MRMAAAVASACLGASNVCGDDLRSAEELKQMSLDELLETKVISISRTPESWINAPNAITVLTHDEIRRSGALRLPDALRLATGLQVARGAGSGYAITARGFNSSGGNKMQVLMDGRLLYTPLLSGVFWEIQDTMMDDLDRIEVVRGPGATLWGANAVNGVINIVSRSAKDTQGMLVTGGGGTEEQAFGGVRYGGQIGEATYYRVYGKYQRRDDQATAAGTDAGDSTDHGQGGFRIDSFLADDNQLTFQGDLYHNYTGILGRNDAEHYGGNLLSRWTRTYSDTAGLQVQAYYDRGIRDVPLQFREDRSTFDLEAQHHFEVAERHKVMIGANYRYSADATGTNGTYQFFPANRGIQLFSGFVQDEIALIPERLTLYAGSKFEHNDFTGFEWQPGVRLAFNPAEKQTLWAGISRAVRTPSRGDSDTRFMPVPATGVVAIRGNTDFRSETVVAYEVGYRIQASQRLLIDIAGFYNQYDRLRTLQVVPPLVVENLREGDTRGVEIEVKYQVTGWWRLGGSFTYLNKDLHFKPGAVDPTAGTLEANDPSHMATLHSSLDLPRDFEFDVIVRYVDRLPNPSIPYYVGLDLRLAWRPKPGWELAVVGQNILDDRHPEFSVGAVPPEVQRGVYGKVTWNF